MNVEASFHLGSVDGVPVIAKRLKSHAFEIVHCRITSEAYRQLDPLGYPARPSGPARELRANELVAMFRCEAEALCSAGFAELERPVNVHAVDANGRKILVPLGDLVDFLMVEAAAVVMAEVVGAVNAALSDAEAVAQ